MESVSWPRTHRKGGGDTYRKPASSFVVDYSLHCPTDSNVLGQGDLSSTEQADVESLKILLGHLCPWLK